MAKKTIREGDLINYTQAMIRHAVYNYPNDVVYLLESNGVSVPEQNVTPQMLHIMTLKAVENSNSFNQGMIDLLHNIAMDDIHEKYKQNKCSASFVNQTGDEGDKSGKSFLSQTLTPDVIKSLITLGIGAASKSLGLQGDEGIKRIVEQPEQPEEKPKPKKSHGVLIVGGLIVTSIIGFGIYYYVKHKKN